MLATQNSKRITRKRAAENLKLERSDLSVYLLQRRQRRERLAGTAGLAVVALACAISIVLITGPLPVALGLAVLVCVAAILTRPRIGLYLLLFCAIFLEQFGIVGLDPLTARFPFYQTLAGSSGLALPVSPVEMVLLLTLAAVVLPHVARRGRTFVRGPLFVPLLLFLVFVVVSVAYGLAGGTGTGPFDLRAAWEETRSFFYLAITYVLACNLLQTQAQLQTFIWFFIAAIGLKSVQGIVRYIDVQSNGLQVDAITGHEDVVFFAAFILLLAGLLLYQRKGSGIWRRAGRPPGRQLKRSGRRRAEPALGPELSSVVDRRSMSGVPSGPRTIVRRQIRVMLVVLPPLLFTFVVTNRRLGFVVLAAGLAMVALLLLRTRRDLFMRLVPLAIVAVGIYLVVFWNGTGTLSEPIRAVRSIFAPTTERDRLSNAWRDLENFNISYNIRTAPVTGLGFGRPYSFAVAQPPLDATGFTYWRYITHDAIYWVWMKMGLIGFILFWNLIGSAIVLGLVTFRQLRDGYLRALALVVTGVVLMQVIFSYGDLGLTYSRSMIFLGCMLGMLAVLTLPGIGSDQVVSCQLPVAGGVRSSTDNWQLTTDNGSEATRKGRP